MTTPRRRIRHFLRHVARPARLGISILACGAATVQTLTGGLHPLPALVTGAVAGALAWVLLGGRR